ncbi:MAG: ATP synthase F0 subunit B, partial [Clostridiales bacterium]|nr:ATP synthase F0 subunit B [Clostridiales bacterium]
MNPQFVFILSDTRQLIDMDLQMFIGMVPNLINFIITAAVLTYFLYKPVRKMLQARADRVEGDMKDAALSTASAAELKEMYEQKVRD